VSYLNPPRLHFSGNYEAAISTVNNDPSHFNNATFRPAYQLQSDNGTNGWFNPRGSGDFRLFGCQVKSALMADGSPVPADDPVLAAIVAESDRAAPAKLVDLDPGQQLASTIWGLEVRIATAAGDTLVRGQFEPTAFIDIWNRAQGPGTAGDLLAGAMYQSVITGLDWTDTSSSPFLRQLRDAASGGMLSVKFNVDGINLEPTSATFLQGRITGTIGAAADGEPRHFVAGRQFMAADAAKTGFFIPAGKINFCAGVLDRQTRRVYVDLGNAMPTAVSGGGLANLGDLALYQLGPTQAIKRGSLAASLYTDASWYTDTAGIAAFPPDRPLTDAELTGLDQNPLGLVLTPPGGQPALAISEPSGGVYIRADQFVFRANPGQEVTADLHATRLGHPYPGASVIMVAVPAQLQPTKVLPVATPPDAIDYAVRLVTDEHGVAQLRIQTHDPGQPRHYIDGQVYALQPALEETLIFPAAPYPHNPANFISLLVWSGFQPDDPPTWSGSIQPILQQYANLYPVMQSFLDLGSYESVCRNIPILTYAFGLDLADPNSMPVTRDLSSAKRAAIVRWLTEPGPDGMPRKGEDIAAAPGPAAAPDEAAPDEADASSVPSGQGGKAAAAARRPASQQQAQALLIEGAGHDPDPS
jgi:hypothetical protein